MDDVIDTSPTTHAVEKCAAVLVLLEASSTRS
jgi:hypothetical protein